jgi:hypothetical protein
VNDSKSANTFVRSSKEVRAEEAWLACATCRVLVESDDRESLVVRGVKRSRGKASEGVESLTREMQNEEFWQRRDQPSD